LFIALGLHIVYWRERWVRALTPYFFGREGLAWTGLAAAAIASAGLAVAVLAGAVGG
jgi:hypothetical protein